jgi:hypothetical protein
MNYNTGFNLNFKIFALAGILNVFPNFLEGPSTCCISVNLQDGNIFDASTITSIKSVSFETIVTDLAPSEQDFTTDIAI